MFHLLKENPTGMHDSFTSTFSSASPENDRESLSLYMQRLLNEIEENKYTADEMINLLIPLITHFLKSYHYYKQLKIHDKMKRAETHFKVAKKYLNDFSPSTELEFSDISEVKSNVRIKRRGGGSDSC
jgi:hypothetical protein